MYSQDARLVLSPHVISGLVSCQVYKLACANLFQDEVVTNFPKDWNSTHTGILTQLAAKWSLYPMEQSTEEDSDAVPSSTTVFGVPVTGMSLSQTLPFKLVSYLFFNQTK